MSDHFDPSSSGNQPPGQFGFPFTDLPRSRLEPVKLLGRPRRTRDVPATQERLRDLLPERAVAESENGQVSGEDGQLAVGPAATAGVAAGVAVDNARLYQEFEQCHRWLTASAVMTRWLLAGQDGGRLDAVLGTAQHTALADFDHPGGFVGCTGVAMERARADQQLLVVDDRDRLGDDLNRHVIQKLVAVGLGLHSRAAITTAPASRQRINKYVADIDAAVNRIRTTIFDLGTDPDTDV